jgi:hypothetical protein
MVQPVQTHKHRRIAGRGLTLLAMAALLAAVLGGTAFGSAPSTWRRGTAWASFAANEMPLHLAQNRQRPQPYFDNLPPDERARMQRQYREWQSLPPDQRDAMRQRMQDWNRMPPQQQERYQQRYQQWQQMSPEDRRKLENNLQRWDKLSPQERDSIRQRFRN